MIFEHSNLQNKALYYCKQQWSDQFYFMNVCEQIIVYITYPNRNTIIIVQRQILMAPSAHEQLQKLRSIYIKLSEMSQMGFQKVQTQKSVYQEIIKIFSKFSSKLTEVSKRINQEILSPSSIFCQEQSVLVHYQFLSNSVLKMAECTKRISLNVKQQVLEPMKMFTTNYKGISDQLLGRIVDNTTKISQINTQLNGNKEHYYSISHKFKKERQMQNRIISKIQSGDKNELQKFNAQIKKLSISIITSQRSYQESVQKMNLQWQTTKRMLSESITSYSNNQETRVSFSKRSVLSTLKLFEQLQKGFVQDAEAKLRQIGKVQKKIRNNRVQLHSLIIYNKIMEVVKQIKAIDQIEAFVTHDDYRKRQKRNQAIEQEHLQQIFKKVRSQDKEKIKQFVESLFDTFPEQKQPEQEESTITASQSQSNGNNSPTMQNQSAPTNKSKRSIRTLQIEEEKLDDIKGRIIEALPYSFYFIQELYQQVLNMTAFYCKLNDQNFYYLLNTFNVVTKSIDIEMTNEVSSEFIYKMVFTSQRISWKRNNSNKGRPIQLLSSHLSKNKHYFNNRKTIDMIYNYLIKIKSGKKKENWTPKNTISNFTKNIFSRKRQKQIILSSDDQFACLSEITAIMANFDIQKQISLIFIKDSLDQSNPNKGKTFEYLKSIILSKKDIQQRRKIFFKTQVKQKRQKKMRSVIQTKKFAQFCIALTAQKGFFSKDQIYLRLLSKYLVNIHWQILAHVQIQTPQKWVHLLPFDQKLQYIQMKQQVAQKSVPSATQQIITLDVNRSLHIHGQTLTPTVLHTLLRVYAFYHADISYCQGMNYIAGYLYLKTLNQQSAYRIFQYLMQIRFKQLFANEFQILKIKMYQFDRLLAIFHPQISQHFKRQGISPQCYIVSWIITLFASSYQYTKQSYLIDTLYERFIIYGWKQFFRFILWVFDLRKEQLIQLTYDRALHSLGQIAKSRFLLASNKQYKQEFRHVENVVDGMNRFQVTQELLDSLASEYKLLK